MKAQKLDADEKRWGRRLQVGDRYEVPEAPGVVWEVTLVTAGSATVKSTSTRTRSFDAIDKETGEAKVVEFAEVSRGRQVTPYSAGRVMLPREETR